MSTEEKPRRKWVYLQKPQEYDMSPCSCGNADTQWSEFEKHLWCAKCEKDFIPEHAGIFDGPVQVKVCRMLGISFDRLNLETDLVERFDEDTNTYNPEFHVT